MNSASRRHDDDPSHRASLNRSVSRVETKCRHGTANARATRLARRPPPGSGRDRGPPTRRGVMRGDSHARKARYTAVIASVGERKVGRTEVIGS